MSFVDLCQKCPHNKEDHLEKKNELKYEKIWKELKEVINEVELTTINTDALLDLMGVMDK